MQLSWDSVRAEMIGRDATILTPYGERYITYADYTASGRGLFFVERYIRYLLELYANTHTEDDSTGRLTSRRLAAAEALIKRHLNADDGYALIAVGAGATAAIHRLQQILGIHIPPVTRERLGVSSRRDDAPVVFVGPYEHHSNEISWREGFAEVIEIELDDHGTLSISDLEDKLRDPRWANREKIGSFSAASNVTGIQTDVFAVARILHQHGARAFFDFSASAPYVKIDVHHDNESWFDGVFFSPHKYIGGPGSAGLLVVHESVYRRDLPPSVAGGGTVRFVSATRQDYIDNIEEREKAGTPGILQTMRAALAIDLQDAMGYEAIQTREQTLLRRAYQRFDDNKTIEPIVPEGAGDRLAIFSFNLRFGDAYLHPRFVVRLLNDLFGIQSRAGCSCAGPYGHRLLNIDPESSEEYRGHIDEGYEGLKPGWVRLNFHYLLTDEEFEFIADAIEFMARYGRVFLTEYSFDARSGVWSHCDDADELEGFGIGEALTHRMDEPANRVESLVDTGSGRSLETIPVLRRYLDEAAEQAYHLAASFDETQVRKTEGDLIPFWYVEMQW